MAKRLALTGSTGRLGGRVAAQLAQAGGDLRLLVRDLARAPKLPGTTAVVAPFGDPAAVKDALTGIDLVLMVSAAETPNRVAEHVAFVDAAAAAGVEHVVYTSFLGASPVATFTLARDHHATEQHIRRSGMKFTFLRDNLYADFIPMMVGPDGVIRGPAGDGRVSAVAQDDIAEAAVAVLRGADAHAGVTYDLTGPEALSLAEIAAILSGTTGRPVKYEPETIAEAYASRASFGAPRWQVDAWVSTYTAIAAGEMATVSPAIERLTGHPPRSLRELRLPT